MDGDDIDDEYGDDPTDDLPVVSEHAVALLELHRRIPDEDAFILMDGFTLSLTDELYRALLDNGLVEYADRIVTVAGERRYTFLLTRDGL